MSLDLRNVSKSYAGGAGHLVAFFGPSGSGKTSLLHMAGLLLRPDAGEVRIDGDRVDDLSESAAATLRRTKLGFVFQSAGLLPLLSAYENVDVALRLVGVSGREAKDRTESALATVGMAERMRHRPDELSGGEQQRVAIARALVHRPAYIFADEPTGELDTATGASILDLLRSVAGMGSAVVMASHDPAALDYVDRAMYVSDGVLHEPDRDDLGRWLNDGTAVPLG